MTTEAKTVWTREKIRELLNKSDKAVCRALVALYERQTADEQSADETSESNGVGFNGVDACFASRLAKQVLAWRPGKYASPLSPKQIEAARKLLMKYAGQLARIANAK